MTNSANDTNILSASDRCKAYIFESAESFLKYLSPNGPVFGEFDLLGKDFWIFRGHKSSEYELKPSAFREGERLLQKGIGDDERLVWKELRLEDPEETEETKEVTFEDQIKAEYYTVKEFFRLADEQGLPLPEDSQRLRAILHSFDDLKKILKEKADREQKFNEASEIVPSAFKWPPKELRSLLALAQHYGLPTRLLDWSYSPQTAAWFAADGVVRSKNSEETDTKGGYLDVWALNKSALLDENNEEKRDEQLEFSLKIITAPTAGNPNLHAQKGLFTMIRHIKRKQDAPKVPDEAQEKYWEEEENVDEQTVDNLLSNYPSKISCKSKNDDAFLLRFLLPHNQAERLLNMLAREGLTKADLFPGYYGVAKTLLRDRTYWADSPTFIKTDKEETESEQPEPCKCRDVVNRLGARTAE